jgi:trimeric autotransporter adhesin
VSLTADWSGNTGGGGGITMVDTAVSATGNILVDSKVNSDGMSAITAGNGGSGRGFSAVSTGNGDVTFTANKGAIGLGNLTTKIKGKDVTFDNGTGASGINTGVAISGQGIDAAGKIYIKGTALGSGAGVNVAGAYTTTGTSPNDTVYVEGTSATGDGVRIGTIGSLPSANQSVVTIKGTSLGGTGSGIAQTGAITAKSINMTGNSVGGAGITGMGVLTATGNIDLEGNSTSNNGLVINNTVTSTGGNITATASAANTTKVALAISGSGALIASGTNQNINMVANTMDFSGATAINAGTTGTVNITTKDAATAIRIGVDDGSPVVQQLSLNQTELSKITAAKTVIGDSLNTGGISVDGAVTTASVAGDITLLSKSNISVNKALTVGGSGATRNLTLNGAGATSVISQTAEGVIKSAGLELLGSNATHTLINASNQVATLAANTKAIDYLNSGALTLGSVNTVGVNATGDVNIATSSGNLTIAQNVSTTSTSTTALQMNAGKSTNAGTKTGGDVIIGSGGSVSSPGRVTFMTGSIDGSTGLDVTAGDNRYNSDESVTNYTALLGATGRYAIYREAPTLTVNVNNASKTYDGFTYSGGNGFTESTSSAGLKNGDALSSATAGALYGGAAQGAKNASITPYTLSASEGTLGKSALGYVVSYNSGTLTINKADLTVTAQGVTKTYDGTTNATGNGLVGTLAGATAGEVVNSAGIQAFTDKNFGVGNKTVKASGVTIKDSGNVDVTGNYNIAYTDNTTSTINKADLTVTAQGVTKTYDGTTNATGNGLVGTLAGATAGEVVNSAGIQAFTDKNFGVGNKTVKASGVTIKDSGNVDVTGNYNIAYTDNTTSTINKKDATVSAAGNSVIFNSQLQTDKVATDGFIVGDKVGSVIGAGSGTQAGTYQSNLALTGGDDSSNYNVVFKNAAFTISAQNYVRPPVESTILSPVTFGLAFTGGATAAGGDGVDISSACDAWSSRGGGGSVSVMTLLKPSFMGLRTAKTDTMEAMSGGSASSAQSDAGASPCGGPGSLAQK